MVLALFRSTLTKCVVVGSLLVSCGTTQEKTVVPSNPKLAALQVPEGFHAEHLFGPSENGEGSWVSMTFDDKGRLIASDQYGALYRMNIPAIGDALTKVVATPLRVPSTEKRKDTTSNRINMGYAHGLLYAFNSLYVVVNHHGDKDFPTTSGLYRLQDTDGDDEFDKITLLKELEGSGEHGPHSIVLSPDKKSLYLIAGNFTAIPSMNRYRVQPEAQLDNLLPMIRDPRGHDNNVAWHGGWIAHLDSTGTDWELYASGFRNPFDLAFNDAGDMFTYDSDMEWDMGTPWYRPTRICHVTSGADFGWRPGTGKWHPGFADSRPAILNIGQGSPTNLVYGANARFPEKYRRALFAFDWSFGIIYAIHLEPDGSGYRATGEEFISGSPLPLTDGVIGPDGALYFLTGGRRLESDLYRVYYKDGNLPIEPLQPAEPNEANKIRRQLEAHHANPGAEAIEQAWPYLNHEDDGIRFAAVKTLEQAPLSAWKTRLLNEADTITRVSAMVALSKKAKQVSSSEWQSLLEKTDYQSLGVKHQLALVRALEVWLSRTGKPAKEFQAWLAGYLEPHYPNASDDNYNRQLSKVLVYLQSPKAIAQTFDLFVAAGKKDPNKAEDISGDQTTLTSAADLIMRNPDYGMSIAEILAKLPPLGQTFYATVLSQADNVLSEEQLDQYFKWYANAFQYQGGYSYSGFINQSRKMALAHVPKNQFAYYNTISGDSIADRPPAMQAEKAVQPKGPGRNWTVEEAMRYVDSGIVNRDFERGRGLFISSLCASCHAMNGEGGVSGPDLTQLGTRFSYKDMLEAIIEPSKVISDQYGATVFYLKSGKSIVGRLIEEKDGNYIIAQNPFAPDQHRAVPKKEVIRTRVSEISPMLPEMIDRLNPEELKDLLAFLKSGGNKEDTIFRKSSK